MTQVELVLCAMLMCLAGFTLVLAFVLLHTRDEVRKLGVGFFSLGSKQRELVLHLEVVENAVKDLARG